MKHEPVKDHAERKRIFALIEQCEKKQTMSRYIDPIWLYENVREQSPQFAEILKNLILVAPSIDIVRCKECKHWRTREDETRCCVREYATEGWRADDFCSYGEREDE